MEEGQIKTKAKEKILKQGGIVWFVSPVKYKAEIDIFGAFDGIIIYPPGNIVFIQLTTISNIRAREKKINQFLRRTRTSLYSEIWAYDKKLKDFRIFHIYGGGKARERSEINLSLLK